MKNNSQITILYVGNNLSEKTNYMTSLNVLSSYLEKENYVIYKVSDKINKVHRLFDICYTIIKLRNKINFMLIDTFSTKNFYFAFIASQFSRLYKIKYIPILRGGDLPHRLDKSVKLSKYIFNYSYRNIAPSNYLKAEFNKRDYRVDFIPNVLKLENYIKKDRLELSPTLLWVRAFKNLYNPTLAIETLKIIKKKYSNAKLCMVGPFMDESINDVKKLILLNNLSDSVEITGALKNTEWHKKSEDFDIFINTTNIDNLPVSVMEAMALGLPVVSTNVGGLPYLIDNNIDGVLVSRENPKEMAEAIFMLLDSKDRVLEITQNARRKIEYFSWEKVKSKWLNLLDKGN